MSTVAIVILCAIYYVYIYTPHQKQHRAAQYQLYDDIEYLVQEYYPLIDSYVVTDTDVRVYFDNSAMFVTKNTLENQMKGIFCQIDNLAHVDGFIKESQTIKVSFYDSNNQLVEWYNVR